MENMSPPPNEWETPPTVGAGGMKTGVYAADRVPGTYLKTLTGVQRGEELFHRPDLERPWRSTSRQRHATTLALKEKEIEELMRKCSTLRTQLGNAQHDAKYIEFAADEKAKVKVVEIQKEVDRLEEKVKKITDEKEEIKTSTEHQLRLMKSQHEKDLLQLKNENRLLNERCLELTRIYQQQVDDVKKASVRELEYVESLCNTRVEELKNELRALHNQNVLAEERRTEELANSKNLLHRIETDYKERLREAEKHTNEIRDRLEGVNKNLLQERADALKEVTQATERLTIALTDREVVLERFKQWNIYILHLLDEFFTMFIESRPEFVVEPHDPELYESPSLYTPRSIMEDPDAKVTVERIVYRLLQLRHIDVSDGKEASTSERGEKHVETLEELANKQKRLMGAFKEIEGKCLETEQSLSSVISRLYFFNDNLNDAITNSGLVLPPQKCVFFVCIGIYKGRELWIEDVEKARASISLMNSVIRPKMTQYGAYECYSDGTCMLLAFDDPIGACRFCLESQWWLMNIPWPESLLQSIWGKEEYGEGGKLLYRGLRLSMSVHTGEAFMEPTAIPYGDSYRCHYYGRAVSQVIYICSLAQGGQVIVSSPVWDICSPNLHELGSVGVQDLGIVPILSFNKESNTYETEDILLRQILPQQLLDRTFQRNLPDEESLDVLVFAKMRRSILSEEINCVELRQASLKEAVYVAGKELIAVDRSINSLMHRTREVKSYFHLLPPTEMVVLLNDLYTVMEQVASRASEMRGDLRGLDSLQNELTMQTQGLKNYCLQYAATASRVEEMQTQAEVMQTHFDKEITEMRSNHADKIEQLQRELRERDQLIQRLYRELQSPSVSVV